jgi:8-oxo-dGTP pyrophosphatase MutT (NUDIX family)
VTTEPATSVAGVPVADVTESWPVADRETVWDSGRVISIRSDTITSPSGESLRRDVVVHPGAVGVICLDDDDRVLVVSQYRHPVGHRLIEPVAGLLDVEDEDYRDAAARELFEEGAVVATSWHVLVDSTSSPGMTSEAIRIYLARGVSEVPTADRYVGHGEEAHMQVSWQPIDDLVEGIMAGRLHNPVMIMGVLAAAHSRRNGWADLRPSDDPWTFRAELLAAQAT